MSDKLSPDWQEVVWQPRIEGRIYDVPIPVYSGDGPEVIVLPGLGEERLAAEKAVAVLGEQGINAAGIVLPFHHLEPTPANLERTIADAPLEVVNVLNQQAGKPAEAVIDVVGKSQGGGVAIVTASAAPNRYNALGLIAPVGLTNEFFGSSPKEKRHRFLFRLAVRNNMTPDMNPLRDVGNRLAGQEVLARVRSDMRAGRLNAKLDFALGLDLTSDIAELTKDHPVRIFAGDSDRLFPFYELRASLGSVGCAHVLEPSPCSHVPILSRAGARQLRQVSDWLKTTRGVSVES